MGFFESLETEVPIGIRKVKVCAALAVEEVLGPLGRRLFDEDEPPWAPPPQAARDNDVIIASEVRVKIFFILFFFNKGDS